MKKDVPLLVKGTVDKTEKGIKIVSTEISELDAVRNKGHKVEIHLRFPLTDTDRLQLLKSTISAESKGKYPLYLRIFHKGNETLIMTGMKLSYDNDVIKRVEEITGKGAVIFQ